MRDFKFFIYNNESDGMPKTILSGVKQLSIRELYLN